MSIIIKKPYLPPSLPKTITKYRDINSSSGYAPFFYTQKHYLSPPAQKEHLIIVDEQNENSGMEF